VQLKIIKCPSLNFMCILCVGSNLFS
jgi:hypothetical protein